MDKKRSRRSLGIVSTIVLIVVALVILGYYNVNIRSVVASPVVRDNLAYAWDLLVQGLVIARDWILGIFREYVPGFPR